MGYRSTNIVLVLQAPIDVPPGSPQVGVAGLGTVVTGKAKKIVAQTGRTSMGLSGQISLVHGQPQTGRVSLGLSATGRAGHVDVTGAFTHVTIVRTYELATGEPPTGVVYFTPSDWLLHAGITVAAAVVPAVLDSEGQISISLVANTDPGTVPVNSHYVVHEAIVGQANRTYKVSVPYNQGLSIDLSTLPVIP